MSKKSTQGYLLEVDSTAVVRCWSSYCRSAVAHGAAPPPTPCSPLPLVQQCRTHTPADNPLPLLHPLRALPRPACSRAESAEHAEAARLGPPAAQRQPSGPVRLALWPCLAGRAGRGGGGACNPWLFSSPMLPRVQRMLAALAAQRVASRSMPAVEQEPHRGGPRQGRQGAMLCHPLATLHTPEPCLSAVPRHLPPLSLL